MKESYFSPESYEQKAQEMYQQVLPYRHRRAFGFNPKHSALLVLDMQSYFLDADSHAYIPSARAIIPNLQRLIRAYAERDLPVYFTQHINTSENAGLMDTWWRDLITADSPNSKITPELDITDGVIIQKNQYDAFYNTPLAELLRGGSKNQVIICGVMTHLCCETTARSAFIQGYDVFFTVDGTATYNQEHHLASLLNLSHGFATPVLIGEVLETMHKYDAD
jgi:isochorismate hydrolase